MAEHQDRPVTAERAVDQLSLVVGVLALVGAGLYLLDATGAVQVDEAVALASLWIGLALMGLVRSGISLARWLRSRSGPGESG